MGVRARVVLYAPSQAQAESLAAQAFDRIEALEASWSDYRATSEVRHLSGHPRSGLRISDDLRTILVHAQQVRDASAGAFSPYLGGLTTLWRQARDSGQIPETELLTHRRMAASNARVVFDHDLATLRADDSVSIDLGGIGKGAAAAEAVKVLASLGASSCLVGLAGDIAVGDAPPGRDGWMIKLGESSDAVIFLHNASVSTSGDSVQFIDIGGVRYSHIIDPKTGLGCTSPSRVTVVAPEGWQADALATALCVRGAEGLDMLNAFPQASARIETPQSGVISTLGFPTVWRASASPTSERPAQPAVKDDDLAARLKWFQEARFGMFIHWGLYAIPAGTWKGEKIKGTGEWIMLNAQISPADYETLAPQFNPVAFNAEHWMALAADAGMKYVVTTTKHHDGFCLFDSAFTTYDVMDATPFRRDIMKELADAARKNNLRLGWYHSILDWHHPDAKGERFPEYEKVLHNQVEEILTKYGKVDVVWFDGEWLEEWTPARGQKLYDHCRRLVPQALINNRVGKGRDGMAGLTTAGHKLGDFGTPEQEVPAGTVLDEAWESCMTMNDTWGFRSDDPNFKSSAELIRTLIETVSKGGNFLLNVGPTAEGRIPPESIERLRDIGNWMKVNGESIYGKTAAPLRKTPFGRCTFGDGALYVHLFDLPAAQGNYQVLLPGLKANFKSATFLANPKLSAKVLQEQGGVRLTLSQWPVDKSAVVLKLVMENPEEPLLVEEAPLVQPKSGPFVLKAEDANVWGKGARYERGNEKRCIGWWHDMNTTVSWDARLVNPGTHAVEITLACDPGNEGSEVDIEVQGKVLKLKVPVTRGWADFTTVSLGNIDAKAGNCEVRVRPRTKGAGAVMNLRSITISPASN